MRRGALVPRHITYAIAQLFGVRRTRLSEEHGIAQCSILLHGISTLLYLLSVADLFRAIDKMSFTVVSYGALCPLLSWYIY